MASGNQPRPLQIHFMGGYANDDVLQHAKDMPTDTIEFWCNSNNPVNQPSGCSWGSYLFLSTTYAADGKKRTGILYFDNFHIASTYGINDNTTELVWHIA